MTDHGMVIN